MTPAFVAVVAPTATEIMDSSMVHIGTTVEYFIVFAIIGTLLYMARKLGR